MLELTQQTRLSEFSAEASVDIHCHCLPCLDDGPQSIELSLLLCRALVADGITHVIATPHQLGNHFGTNSRATVLEAIDELKEKLISHDIPLVVLPGADVRIDDQMFAMLDSDQVLTLADQKSFLLLELPHETMIDPVQLLKQLASRGICGILSHPERHALIARKPELVVPWIKEGALLQVTSGSLLGDFGPQAHAASWRLMEAGAVSLIASDAHDIQNRPPRMTGAIRAISDRFGHAVARRLCIENPFKIYSQQNIPSPRISRRFGGGT